jgi:hypothetical protein
MDETTRAFGRRYHREPTPENASHYIRYLERAWENTSNPSILLDIWGSLILGLFDPQGINLAVYESLLDLTKLLFGENHLNELSNRVDATDGRFYLSEGNETWFDDFLLKVGYVCAHAAGCPDAINQGPSSYGHKKCQAAVSTGSQCECPGCYSHGYTLCWHHHQIIRTEPEIDFSIDCDFSSF